MNKVVVLKRKEEMGGVMVKCFTGCVCNTTPEGEEDTSIISNFRNVDRYIDGFLRKKGSEIINKNVEIIIKTFISYLEEIENLENLELSVDNYEIKEDKIIENRFEILDL